MKPESMGNKPSDPGWKNQLESAVIFELKAAGSGVGRFSGTESASVHCS
jgi:hypothetical protein